MVLTASKLTVANDPAGLVGFGGIDYSVGANAPVTIAVMMGGGVGVTTDIADPNSQFCTIQVY